MNDVLIQALAESILSDTDPMTIEQVPEPLRAEVQEIVGDVNQTQPI